MSTRCQVRVQDEHEAITLYHHCDGYPDNMLPLIASAHEKYNTSFRSGRAGHSASFLCAADPEGFEVEEGHELHGDIEWYYRVAVLETPDRQRGLWNVTVYRPSENGTPDDPGQIVLETMAVAQAAERAADFENAAE